MYLTPKRQKGKLIIGAVSALILAIASPTNAGESEAVATTKGEALVDKLWQTDLSSARMLPYYRANGQQIETGQRYYNGGRFAEAVEILERAVNEERDRGNIAGETQGLNLISLAYQKLGKLAEAEKAIAASLSLLPALEEGQEQVQLRAQALNVRGHLLLAQSQAKFALEIWQEAEESYREIGDRIGILGSQINQAQALQHLGLYRRANTLFEEISKTLNAQPDSPIKAAGLHNFGNILRQRGKLEASLEKLKESLKIAKGLEDLERESAILLSLGNTERRRGDIEAALNFYQEAAAIASAPAMTRVQAQLNQLSLSVEQLPREKAIAKSDLFLADIRATLPTLPPSRAAVYAQVQFAKAIVCLERQNAKCLRQQEPKKDRQQDNLPAAKALETASVSEAISILENAAIGAEKLGDNRAWSYTLGTLGRLYEERGEVGVAKTHTEKALNLAQSIHAPDIAYQWQWQLGRLLLKQDNINGATAAYWEAVSTLQALRGDLVTINRDRQFDFRDEVEPVYRKTLALLLRSDRPTQKNLGRARLALEALQLAELDNFFRDACLNAKPEQIDNIVEERDPTAAVVHAIILEDRLATILKLPGDKDKEPLRYNYTFVKRKEVEATLANLRTYLGRGGKTPDAIEQSQKLHRWLMEEISPLLENNSQVKTLVFVLDRPFQNVPMAVLHDGREYLLQKDYAIVLAPGLQLVDPNPLEEARARDLKVFTGGVSLEQIIEGIRFEAIAGVKPELYGIAEVVTAPDPLLDEEFTPPNLEQGLTSELFPVIHIKTHGQFSSDPERTFIVAYEELIKSRGLNELVKTGSDKEEGAIELLVLSACSTAQGDDRAALGLAGIAVRAGARSILSTLWIADDEATTMLMKQFYQELSKPNVTRAMALQRAQLALFNGYKAPNIWATYVLVGNWL